jgi:glutathione S-transferase
MASAKLYYTPTSCGAASFIAARIAGFSLETEEVNIGTKKTASGGDFLAINPKGNVPTLVVTGADGSKTVLNEGAATLQYIADHGANKDAGLTFPTGDIRKYVMLNHLNFAASELHPSIGVFFGKPEGAARDAALTRLNQKLALLEGNCKEQGFLGGAEKVTVAGIYTYICLTWLAYVVPEVKLAESYPKLSGFFKRVAEHEVVKAAHAEMAAAPHA